MAEQSQEQDKSVQDDDAQQPERRRRSEKLEWIIGSVCGLLVLALLGFLAFEALSGGDGMPVLQAIAGPPVPAGESFVVPVRVSNSGRSTAADVAVEGRLVGEGGKEETASTTLDYVAGGSSAGAALIFTADPASGKFELAVKSYTVP